MIRAVVGAAEGTLAPFVRARYAFRLSVEPDGYRIEALPQGGPGRPFLVDDSGFVRVKDE